MLKEGYQPNKGKLDISNPPQGGSGISNKDNIYKKMWERLNNELVDSINEASSYDVEERYPDTISITNLMDSIEEEFLNIKINNIKR